MAGGTSRVEAERRRDDLLAVARGVVAARPEPEEVAARLQAAWPASLEGVVIEPDFVPDPRTGVESLALVVDPGAGALILRLPGELPDSFEVVDTDDGCAGVRRRFFGDQ